MNSEKLLKRIRKEIVEIPVWYSDNCKCKNCGKDYIYAITPMVRNELWNSICKELKISERSLLCKRCMEKGLKREIEISDTTKCPLNFGFVFMYDGNINESKEEKEILEYHDKNLGQIERD